VYLDYYSQQVSFSPDGTHVLFRAVNSWDLEAVAAGGGTFAGTLHQNVIACGHAQRITLIVAASLTAASCFADRSIEWVHLDARHDFASVTADIAAWLPKVKADGWLSGDDYDEVKWPEVVRALRTRLPEARPWSVSQWRWSAL
jgi:hypothetical protein